MKYKSYIFLFLLAVCGAYSCASQYELLLNGYDVDAKYDAAFKYFEAKKYRKAAELFESLRTACDGTPQGDTVQFYQALSNFEYGDLFTAESNFDSFIEVYPRSPFTPRAKYLRIICLYESTYRYELDQVPTNKAIAAVNEYIYENPDSEYIPECRKMLDELNDRLERKAFESAKIYYTIEDYRAAVYALRNVLKDNSENRYREEIKYYTAVSAYKYAFNSIQSKQGDRYIDFIDTYYDFVGEFPESSYRKVLDVMFSRAQSHIDSDYVVPEEYRHIDVDSLTKDKKSAKRKKENN